MTTSDLPAFWTVIPAAGVGSRMRADRPKQYLDLAGRTVIERTLDCFLEHPMLRGLVVCLAEDDPYWPGLDCAASRHVQRAAGGAERAGSVLNGLLRLLELGAQADDWVLVHDAARPNLTRGDLDRLLEELAEDPAGALGAPGGALHMPAGGAVQPGPVGIVLGQADHQAPEHRVFEETIEGALDHGATGKIEILLRARDRPRPGRPPGP